MADAIPPAPPPAALPSSGSAGPVAVTVMSDAGAALKLLDGVLMEAMARNRATKGMVDLVTADGLLHLKAQPGANLPAIPAGARLTLQMMGGGEGGQWFLTAINGRPLAGTMLAGGASMAGLPTLPGGPLAPGQGGGFAAGKAGLAAPGLATPTAGQVTPPLPGQATATPLGLTATVIRPAQRPEAGAPVPAFAGLPPDLPAGTRLTVRINGIFPPMATPDGPIPPSSASQAATPAMPVTTSCGPPPPGAALPVLPGTVIAHPPGGHAVVQTAIGTLAVPTHADLPAGTQLALDVVGAPLPPPPAAAARPEGLTPQGWPALSETLDVLTNANQPQALEQLLRVIPQADTRLAASMVAFTGALRSGDTKALLPDSSVRGLEKAGKKDLAARLKGDLEALAEETSRPVGNGDWRVYPLPLLGGGFIEPVRLFVRKAGDDEGGGRGGECGNDHRFVVDLNLTRLGRLQLDGLVRREDKLFDLIIRTGEAMSADMRRDILGIFAEASELVGTKGTVSFQAGGRWIDLPPAPPAPTRLEV